MAYDFVQAKYYSPGARLEVRALVIHFAEGGGTVSWFTHPNSDVSSSFVIEYSGHIVQMVKDGDADHCQHVSRGQWSYPGELSPANGYSVLGSEVIDHADTTRVNRYVQAIELEGFRADGMNAAQEASLLQLVTERKAKYGAQLRGLIGHGDVQDKPCPGAKIPWDLLGGHGLFAGGQNVQFPLRRPGNGRYGTVAVPVGTTVYNVLTGASLTVGNPGSGGWGSSSIHDVPGGSAGFDYTSDASGAWLWVDADHATMTQPANCDAAVTAALDVVHQAEMSARP